MAHPAVSPAHEHDHAAHHGSFMPLLLTVGATLFLLGFLPKFGGSLVLLVLALLTLGSAVAAGWRNGPAEVITLGIGVLLGLVALASDVRASLPDHWLMAPGFIVMVASVWGWVREDVHELRGKPFQEGHSDYWLGTIILILSEVVIFGILFSFYFWSRAHTQPFVPEQILHMNLTPIVANTVVLLSSGATVHAAQVYLKKGQMRRFQFWLASTILLGVIFIYGQIREYQELIHEGLTAPTSVYATAFYSLTGVHGLHVVAGIVALSIILGLSFTGFIRKERASGVEGAFLYWHFVDAIWVIVFSVVYLRLV